MTPGLLPRLTIGVTLSHPKGGFIAQCLTCGEVIRLRVQLRSYALNLLEDHHQAEHDHRPEVMAA